VPTRRRGSAIAVEIGVVVAILLAFVLLVAPTMRQPLLESSAPFRQTQTAYTARIFHEQGIDLLHPKLPVLGEPFEVPFEFPLFQAAAALVMDAGIADDLALRSTALLCFLLTAVFLYGLVRRVDTRASALGALVAFLATPFALLWGRASLMEYLATAGGVGFAWATVAWRENRRPAVGALAVVAGVVGMLVKPTTAVFWLLPALVYRPGRHERDPRSKTAAWLAILVGTPLVATALWTRHADAIKDGAPLTRWLTSSALTDWNFGPWKQRFDPDIWRVILERANGHVVSAAGVLLLVAAAFALLRSQQWRFWVAIALAAVLPPFVFSNLYYIHDYYLAAITPAVAALIGLGVGAVWRRVSGRPVLLGLAGATALILTASSFARGPDYWRAAYVDDPAPVTLELAREVDAHTEPPDRVGVVGLDWAPTLLYYAHRWGLMVPEGQREVAYDALHAQGYRYLVVTQPETDLQPLARWKWLGARDSHSYALADVRSELDGAKVVATDDVQALPSARAVLRSAYSLKCDEPVELPGGASGTVLRIANPSPRTRLTFPGLAPLPARRAILVDSSLTPGGRVTVECSGQTELVVDVLDAPLRNTT
jgi:hypothetical protein